MNGENELHEERYRAIKSQSIRCDNDAPHIAVRHGEKWRVYQGVCNSWNCSRCGVIRAQREYQRIYAGASDRANSGNNLAFITLTSRGKGTDVDEAESDWYKNTTKTMNAFRNKVKRNGDVWSYACVTERQKRGHPHAHYIITAVPDDTAIFEPDAVIFRQWIADERVYISDWLLNQLIKSGMGYIHDIQFIDDIAGVVGYVSKYLFKSLQGDVWPKGWRRVRYSRDWKARDKGTADDGFALLHKGDWKKLGAVGPNVTTDCPIIFEHVWQSYAPNLKLTRSAD